MVTLAAFNAEDADQAARRLRPCLDVERWVTALVRARPYADLSALRRAARDAAGPFTDDELEQALSHHPRIGDQAAGAGAEATFSRGEQGGLSLDDQLRARLREENLRYEERFDRVFLIRAAGRSTEEILAELERRLGNSDAAERDETAQQLREIAVLRLEEVLT